MKNIRKYFNTVFHNERNPSLNTVILYRRKHVKGYSIELIKDDTLQSRQMIKVNLDLVICTPDILHNERSTCVKCL